MNDKTLFTNRLPACRIQRGEDASPFPGGQDLLGRPGHSFKRRGEEEAGEAR